MNDMTCKPNTLDNDQKRLKGRCEIPQPIKKIPMPKAQVDTLKITSRDNNASQKIYNISRNLSRQLDTPTHHIVDFSAVAKNQAYGLHRTLNVPTNEQVTIDSFVGTLPAPVSSQSTFFGNILGVHPAVALPVVYSALTIACFTAVQLLSLGAIELGTSALGMKGCPASPLDYLKCNISAMFGALYGISKQKHRSRMTSKLSVVTEATVQATFLMNLSASAIGSVRFASQLGKVQATDACFVRSPLMLFAVPIIVTGIVGLVGPDIYVLGGSTYRGAKHIPWLTNNFLPQVKWPIRESNIDNEETESSKMQNQLEIEKKFD